jgi:hypothetical protein
MKYGADGCAAMAWAMNASASSSLGLRSTCFSRSNKPVSNSRSCGVIGQPPFRSAAETTVFL